MHSSIQNYCAERIKEFNTILPERQLLLQSLSDYMSSKRKAHQPVNLVYICTHNSRRSHFGQIWAKVAAGYYGIKNLNTFSGGTEVTAFNSNAIAALTRAGFTIIPGKIENNTHYGVIYDDQETPVECFSKVYNDAANPQKEFAAIMTCGEAEANCPFIPGAELRIATTYDDPKAFDNTPQQDAKYDERCRQIALETLYAFSLLT